MPHLTIEYSANLESGSMTDLCRSLSAVLAQSGLFPVGGIRVRAIPAQHHAIADDHPDNAFADMVLRIGAGRSDTEKQATGKALMAAAERHFAKRLATPHFALSLEIVDVSQPFSWKANTIHPRLAGGKNG